jgi:hypothetical protein
MPFEITPFMPFLTRSEKLKLTPVADPAKDAKEQQ